MSLDIVALGTSAIISIFWFARLESRIKNCEIRGDALEKALDQLIGKHEALDSTVLEELARVRESLARLEGMLSIPNKTEKRK